MSQAEKSKIPSLPFKVRIFRSACLAIVLILLGRVLGFC